jgi:hypothetical protein
MGEPEYSAAQFEAMRLEIACLSRENAEQLAEIERLRAGLRGIRREFGHQSINNGTSTLGLFIDMLVRNDIEAARELKAAGGGDVA